MDVVKLGPHLQGKVGLGLGGGRRGFMMRHCQV